MKTRSLISTAVLLFVGTFIAFALPTTQRGTLSVTVLDNLTNSPIKDATIEVIETKQKAKTDAAGIATLVVVVGQTGSSTYTIKADHSAYIYQTQKNVSISANPKLLRQSENRGHRT